MAAAAAVDVVVLKHNYFDIIKKIESTGRLKERVLMKKAFTLLELVFVIVVIGILAAVILPRVKTNPVAEAAVHLLSQIRYTQHLAIIDDKFTQNNTWYKDRWQIVLNGNRFSIVSDNNTRFAKDPQTDTDISSVVLKGVTSVTTSGGCANQSIISFDHLGRPLVGSLAATTAAYTVPGNNGALLTVDCNLTLANGSDENVTITIRPETGYASIEP
ncbi:type II secretion system GspH family protein [Sulfurimonas sp. NW7]|uniref:type II secretion system protein n=1 Tax=Sulfurimonas sp. NW7 TaxID=2922727 RepID=UPI003DA8CB81